MSESREFTLARDRFADMEADTARKAGHIIRACSECPHAQNRHFEDGCQVTDCECKVVRKTIYKNRIIFGV